MRRRAVRELDLSVRIGDAGLFSGLLAALDLAPEWRRRIARGHSQGKSVAAILNASRIGAGRDHSGVLGMLEGADKQGARAFVEDLLSIAGIASVGGRTPAEIADRFLEQAALESGVGVFGRKASRSSSDFCASRAIPIAPRRNCASSPARPISISRRLSTRFDTRLGFIAALGFDVGGARFAARFTRNLDYYTGFVFEAHDRTRPEQKPVVAGGRYDQLLQTLGAARAIPAVGAAIWIDRLGESPSAGGQARMSDTLVLAVPSKGRLQENAAAFFARAGLDLVQGRGARDYRGQLAGLKDVEIAFLSAADIVAQLASGQCPYGRHRRGSRSRDARRRRRESGAFDAARIWRRQCRRRRAARLDRRAHHGRSRGCRGGLPGAARRAHARRDEIHQSDAALLRQACMSPIIASSKARARPKARPPRGRPNSSSTSRRPARRLPPMR